MTEASNLRVDVVLCTRNRSELLARTCEAILGQDYPAELWRLLIVDNASTDDTFAVALALAQRFPGRVRAVQCHQLGHSAARNFGVKETSAEIVAFTDDDALPDPGWLRTLVQVIDREGAEASGGPVELVLSGELPRWFLENYLLYLAIWRPADEFRQLTYNEFPRGVNLAFRRQVFDRYGFFSSHLGLRGERQLFCEETELCLRIERNGGRIVYSPQSLVRHCVDARRFTVNWLSRRFAAQGRSEAIVNWMHGGLRGLVLGSRVHLANLRAASWQSVLALRSAGFEGLTGTVPGPESQAELQEAARILTHCRRRALFGYLRQIPLAFAAVPRYRPANGSKLERWTPP
ncbi:MAG TPA: glycosyltransferase [Thermoanaerobaculia bacterium]|jgi:glycosyltransferase involved in cell wall biosynthesis|nr:glycosyltransferase [Thermoanaerobaculia bacterium]